MDGMADTYPALVGQVFTEMNRCRVSCPCGEVKDRGTTDRF